MPKIPLLKRRNGKQREAYAQSRYLQGLAKSAFEQNPYRIIRTALATEVETEISKREFENELSFNCKFFFGKIQRFAIYANEFDLIWRELEKGATFYTNSCAYNVEFLNNASKTPN